MSYYFRLKKINSFKVSVELRKRIRQLKGANMYDMEEDLIGIPVIFYMKEKFVTPVWIRCTLPFAGLVAILLIILMPVFLYFYWEVGV